MAGNKADKRRQLYAALIATSSGIAVGAVFSYGLIAKRVIAHDFHLSNHAEAWVLSIMHLGGVSSMFVTAVILDRLGRKKTMMCMIPVMMVGWLVLAFGHSLITYLVGLFLIGMGAAPFGVAVPVYIGEIAQKEIRGFLVVLYQLQITSGMFWTYTMGLFRSILILSLANSIPLIVFASLVAFMPESPIFLLCKGKNGAAAESLQWLRGKDYNISEELTEMRSLVEESNKRKESFKGMLKHKPSIAGLGISILLMCCQRTSGINNVSTYGPTFYAQIFTKGDSNIDTYVWGVKLGILLFLSTFVCSLIADRVNHRTLLIVSHTGMGVCLLCMGTYFFVQKRSPEFAYTITGLPWVSFSFYIVFYSLGSGPLPWLMVGELFPIEIKGIATSISVGVNWLMLFIITLTFHTYNDQSNLAAILWTYAELCILSSILILLFVIDTRNKSLEEIQKELVDESE